MAQAANLFGASPHKEVRGGPRSSNVGPLGSRRRPLLGGKGAAGGSHEAFAEAHYAYLSPAEA